MFGPSFIELFNKRLAKNTDKLRLQSPFKGKTKKNNPPSLKSNNLRVYKLIFSPRDHEINYLNMSSFLKS